MESKFTQRNIAAGQPKSNKSYTATKTTINRPPAKKTVAAKVVAPAKVVTPTKPTVKKEGMVDVNKYVERLPGGEIREIKYGEYKTLSGTGRNVQTFTPAQFEKIKNRL